MRRLSLAPIAALVLTIVGLGQSLPVVPVAGQPFSADMVIVQNPKPNVHNVLPMKTVRIYRDSAGRSREDVSIPRDPTATQVVNIEDPVAGVHYYLDIDANVARRLAYARPAAGASTPTGKPAEFSFSKFHDVRTTSESLGTQVIEGLATEGQRVTSVSPGSMPGCEENASAIESWYSTELRMTLLQKWSNCLGTGTIHLEHIQRAEPDGLLFQIPAGYKIVEQAWSGKEAK